MVHILGSGLGSRNNVNKMAFSGFLFCPHPHKKNHLEKCNAQRWKFKGYTTPTRIRYQCKECGKFVQYDISK